MYVYNLHIIHIGVHRHHASNTNGCARIRHQRGARQNSFSHHPPPQSFPPLSPRPSEFYARYIYTYIYVYTHIHVYTHNESMHIYVYTRVHTYMYTYTYTYV